LRLRFSGEAPEEKYAGVNVFGPEGGCEENMEDGGTSLGSKREGGMLQTSTKSEK